MLRRSGYGLLGKPVCQQKRFWSAAASRCRARIIHGSSSLRIVAIRSNGLTPIACSLIEMPHYWFEFAVLNRGGVDAHLQLPQIDENGALVNDSISEAWIAGLKTSNCFTGRTFFAENTLTAGDAETVAMFGDGEAAFCSMGRGRSAFGKLRGPAGRFCRLLCCPRRQAACRPRRSAVFRPAFITRKAWDDPDKREAAVAFVSQLTSDAVIEQFVTTGDNGVAAPPASADGNSFLPFCRTDERSGHKICRAVAGCAFRGGQKQSVFQHSKHRYGPHLGP